MYIPSKQQAEEIVAQFGSPVYVTDANYVREQVKKMRTAFSSLDMKIFYAVKANFNPSIVKTIRDAGAWGIDAVSPNEIRLALELGYSPEQIIFTPSFPTTAEIQFAAEKGVLQNLGSLSAVRRYAQLFPGTQISIRICPEVGEGEFAKIVTGHSESKFGIALQDLEEAQRLCAESNVDIVGIHSHIGSGFYEPTAFAKSVEAVCKIAEGFPAVRFLDFGGGFGVQYHPEKPDIALEDFAEAIQGTIAEFEKNYRKVELRIEPGKFLVSQSTVLLTTVSGLKEKGGIHFVGVDSGMSNLIRPAMYDAYHHVVNVSRPDAEKREVRVVGNVCESGDVFNHNIDVADPREGDLLAILVAGGYGSSMSSNYNLREHITEVLVDGENLQLTRKRQTFEEMMDGFAI